MKRSRVGILSSFYPIRKSVAILAALAFGLSPFHAVAATVLTPDGSTSTTVTPSSNVYDVRTATVRKSTGFNSFNQFQVGTGDTVRLHLPVNTQNLMNVVSSRIQIDGTLKSLLSDSTIGGKVFFASPQGFVVGAQGVVNVGALNVSTPQSDYLDMLRGSAFDISSTVLFPDPVTRGSAIEKLAAGDYEGLLKLMPQSSEGVIDIQGSIHAAEGVTIRSGAGLTLGGTGLIFSGARFDANGGVVNLDAVSQANTIVDRGGRIWLETTDNATIGGTLMVAAPAAPTAETKGKIDIIAGGSEGDTATIKGATFKGVGQGAAVLADATVTAHTVNIGDVQASRTNLTINATESLTVNAYSTISMRTVTNGPVPGTVVADSGDLTLNGENITVYENVKIYAQGDTDGTNTHNGGSVTLSASNEALDVLGFKYADSKVEIRDGVEINARKVDISAKATADNSWTYGGESHEGDDLGKFFSTAADAVVYDLPKLFGEQFLLSVAETNAEVNINSGATITASDSVSLSAQTKTAAGSKPSLPIVDSAVSGAVMALPVAAGFTYGDLDATAKVSVASGATVTARDFTARAYNDAKLEADLTVASARDGNTQQRYDVAVAVTNTKVVSNVDVAGTMAVSGALKLEALNDGTYSTQVNTSTGANGVAAAGIGVAVRSTEAKAKLSGVGNTIQAQSVDILAVDNVKKDVLSVATGVKAFGVWDEIESGALSGIRNGLAHPKGGTENNWLQGKIQGSGPWNGVVGSGQNRPDIRAAGAFAVGVSSDSAKASIEGLITAGSATTTPNLTASGAVTVAARTVAVKPSVTADAVAKSNTQADNLSSDTTSKGVAAAVAVGDFHHDTAAVIGEGVKIEADKIGVAAETILKNRGAGTIFFGDDLGIPPSEYEEAVSQEVRNLLASPSPAEYGNLHEDAGKVLTLVKALGKDAKHYAEAVPDLLNPFNSNATATAKSDESQDSWAAAGSIGVNIFSGKTVAEVQKGAQLVAHGAAGEWSAVAPQTPRAPDDPAPDPAEAIGPFQFKKSLDIHAGRDALIAVKAGPILPGDSGATGVGLASTILVTDSDTEAVVREGVHLTASAGSIGVHADSRERIVSIATGAGLGETYGIHASAAVNNVNMVTKALVDDEARISAQAVEVSAVTEPVAWAVGGAIGYSKAAVVGVGVGYNDVEAETKAEIADNDTLAVLEDARASLISADKAGAEVTTNALDVHAANVGRIGALSVAGSFENVGKEKEGDKTSNDPGFFDKLQSKYKGFTDKAKNWVDSFNPKQKGSQSTAGTAAEGANSNSGQQQTTTSPEFGIAGAGSGSANYVDLAASARVEDADIALAGGERSLAINGVSDVDLYGISGAVAFTRANGENQTWTATVSGGVAVNSIGNGAEAVLRRSTVSDTQSVAVRAATGGEQLTIAGDVSIDATSNKQEAGYDFGAAVAVTHAKSDDAGKTRNYAHALVDQATITGYAAGTMERIMEVGAFDRSHTGTVAGNAIVTMGESSGTGGSLGAAVAYADVRNDVSAVVSGATVSGMDKVDVSAVGVGEIWAIGASLGVTLKENNASGQGTVVVTDIENRVEAAIDGGSTVTAAKEVVVQAKDRDPLPALENLLGQRGETWRGSADSQGLYQALNASDPPSPSDQRYEDNCWRSAPEGGSCVAAIAGTLLVDRASTGGVGLSVTRNAIDNNVTAAIEDAAVNVTSSTGKVDVQAAAGAEVAVIAADLMVGAGSGDGIHAGGAVAVNIIDGEVTARAGRTAATGETQTQTTVSADTVHVQAADNSRIDVIGGQLFLGKGSGIGGAVVVNVVESDTKALAQHASFTGKTEVEVDASTDAAINGIVGNASLGSGEFALGASVAVNWIGNTTEAAVESSQVGAASGTLANLSISATDNSDIFSIVGNATGSTEGAAIGGGLTFNRTGNLVRASLKDSTVEKTSAVTLSGATHADIESLAAGVAVTGGSAGLAGAFSINWVDGGNSYDWLTRSDGTTPSGNATIAEMVNTTVNGQGTSGSGIHISATDTSTIKSLAAQVAGSTGGFAGGAAWTDNSVKNAVGARTDSSRLQNATEVTVEAKDETTIKSLSAGLTGSTEAAVNITGSSSRIKNRVLSALDYSTVTGGTANVNISAEDKATIQTIAGKLDIAGEGGGGIAAAVNSLGNETEARVKGKKDGVASDVAHLLVQSKTDQSIWTIAAGAGVAGEGAGEGSLAVNILDNKTISSISNGAQVHAAGNIGVKADGVETVSAYGGALGVGIAAGAGAASGIVNKFNSTTRAFLEGTASQKTEVTALAVGNDELTVYAGQLTNGTAQLSESLPGDNVFALAENPADRTTENLKGIAVNASAARSVSTLLFNVSGGAYGAGGVNGVVDVIDGTTEAYISNANVNQGKGAPSSEQAVSVKASDHTYVSTGIGTLSGAMAAGAISGDVAVHSGNTAAYVQDANVKATKELQIAAVTTSGISSLVGSAATAAAGSVTVALFDGTTEAYVTGGSVNAATVNVRTDRQTVADIGDGAAAVGGAALGGAVGVVSDGGTASARLEGTSVDATLSVGVEARNADAVRLQTKSGGLSATVSVDGSVGVAALKPTTEATIKGSRVGSETSSPASVNVRATNTAAVDNEAGGIAAGVAGGAGAAVAVSRIDGNTQAAISEETVSHQATPSNVRGGVITVQAEAVRDVATNAVSAGVGAVAGLDASVAVSLVGKQLPATMTGSNDTAAILSASAAQAGSGQRAADDYSTPLQVDVNNLVAAGPSGGTAARVASSTVTAAGDLVVTALEKDRIDNSAGSMAGGLIGLGAAVSVGHVHQNVSAAVESANITSSAGQIDLTATAGRRLTDRPALNVSATQGGGGVALEGGVAVSDGELELNVQARVIDSHVAATGAGKDITILASETSDVASEAAGYAGAGLIAAGVVSAEALQSGTVQAQVSHTGRPSSDTKATLSTNGGNVEIEAVHSGATTASGTAGAGGILAGVASASATAEDNALARSQVLAGVIARTGGGDFDMDAGATPEVSATAAGYDGAVLAGAGDVTATAKANPTVEVSAAPQEVSAYDIRLEARRYLPQTNGTVREAARAEATAGGGGLLWGRQATEATAENTGNVTATANAGTWTASDDNDPSDPAAPAGLAIHADDDRSGKATAKGITVSGIAADGPVTAAAKASGTASAMTSGGTFQVKGLFKVNAEGSLKDIAEANSGGGGGISHIAAQARTTENVTTLASAGGTVTGLAGTSAGSRHILINARRSSDFNAWSDSVSAGVAGFSGAETTNDVTLATTAQVAEAAHLTTQKLQVTAQNTVDKTNPDPDRADRQNADAGTGGALDVSAAKSSSEVTSTAAARIARDAIVTVKGDPLSPALIATIGAANTLTLDDKARIDSGGVIEIPKAESLLTATPTAQVEIAAGAKLNVDGDALLYTVDSANLTTQAIGKTYGLAGAAGGASKSDVEAAQTVTINGEITAAGTVDVKAGHGDGSNANSFSVTAHTDLFNWTALPIGRTPEAEATINNANSITVGSQGKIATGRDIDLLTEDGSQTAEAIGTGRDAYREAAGAVASTISELFGGDEVSLLIHGGTVSESATRRVKVDGTLEAGTNREVQFVTDSSGTATTNVGNVRSSVSNEAISPYGWQKYSDLNSQLTGLPATASQDEKDYLKGELNSVRTALLATGRVRETSTDDATGAGQKLLELIPNQTEQILEISPAFASGGTIRVAADSLTGTGSFQAHGDARINIEHAGPQHLRLKGLHIDDNPGGEVLFNGARVASSAEINLRNLGAAAGETAAFTAVSAPGAGSEPQITVSLTHTGEPELFVSGTITNLSGKVSLSNTHGGIQVLHDDHGAGNIDAGHLNITSGGNFVLYGGPVFHTSGDPANAWASEHAANKTSVADNHGKTYTETKAGVDEEPTMKAKGTVAITADYINVNGLIRSGVSDFAFDPHPMLNGPEPTQQFKNDVDAGRITNAPTDYQQFVYWWDKYGEGNHDHGRLQLNPAASDFAVWAVLSRDKDNKVQVGIEVDPIRSAAGRVELTGKIVSTGGGRIEVLDGAPNITVNAIDLPVTIKDITLDASTKGSIHIVDYAKATNGVPAVQTYTRNPGDARDGQTYSPVSNNTWYVFAEKSKETVTKKWDEYWTADNVWGDAEKDHVVDTSSSTVSASSNAVPFFIKYKNSLGLPSGTKAWYTNTTVKNDGTAQKDGSDGVWDRDFPHEDGTIRHYTKTDTTDRTYSWRLATDNPIPISFIGHDAPQVTITGNNISLSGDIRNSLGTTTLTGTKNISQAAGATIVSKDLSLTADQTSGAIGSADRPVAFRLSGGKVDADGGNIFLDSLGAVNVGRIGNNDTNNLTLQSRGDIIGIEGWATHVRGKNVRLISETGKIGAAGGDGHLAIQVGQNSDDPGVQLNASAAGDIRLKQINGDLKVDSVVSAGGDVSLKAPEAILDANTHQTRDPRTEEQLLALWKGDARVTGDKSAQSEQATLTAYAGEQQRRYKTYWMWRQSYPAEGSATLPYVPFFFTEAERQAMSAAGMTTAQIDNLQARRAAEINEAHTLWGGGTYEANFTYQISPAERSRLLAGSTWTEDHLKFALPGSILFKETPHTEYVVEEPNIVGNKVTLEAGGRGVGRKLDDASIKVTDARQSGLTRDQKLLLAAAETDDISLGGRGDNQVVWIHQREDLDIQARGALTVAAGDHSYLGSENDLLLQNITVRDGDLLLKTAGGIGAVAGEDVHVQAGHTVLEAGGGAIGSALVPVRTELGGHLTARAAGDIHIIETRGELNLAEVYTASHASLAAPAGSIRDARGELRPFALEAGSAELTARNEIGKANAPLFLTVSGDGGLTVTARAGIHLENPTTRTFHLANLTATNGVISLTSEGPVTLAGTMNGANDATIDADSLFMLQGSSLKSETKTVRIFVDRNADLGAGLIVGSSSSNDGEAIIIESGGRILGGILSAASGGIALDGQLGIGSAQAPVAFLAGSAIKEASSEAGSIYLQGRGDLTIVNYLGARDDIHITADGKLHTDNATIEVVTGKAFIQQANGNAQIITPGGDSTTANLHAATAVHAPALSHNLPHVHGIAHANQNILTHQWIIEHTDAAPAVGISTEEEAEETTASGPAGN